MDDQETFTILGFYQRNPKYMKMEVKNMTEQTKTWQEQEKEALGTSQGNIERLPALKLVENTITEIVIDVSKPFSSYDTTDMKGQKVVKAIIPVVHNGDKKNWWLNKKNPTYRQILDLSAGKQQLTIKLMQVGSQAATKYVVIN